MATVTPLVPNVSFVDLVAVPLCLAAALWLYDLEHSPPLPHAAHLFRNRTTHARFLPKPSTHAFTYSLLQVGVDLDALQRRHLDLPLLFRFAAPSSSWSFSACSLRSRHYLAGSGTHTLKQRLLHQLRCRAIDTSRIGSCYLVTMPSYLGYEPINPLSVYFCYDDAATTLKVVVLEVNSTFGERHVYVLVTGQREDEQRQSGYDHQWTFARTFHVSPFNDRSGSYTLCLCDPLPFSSSTPKFKLKIVTLTEKGHKKLYASLTGTGQPWSTKNFLTCLILQPTSLLLTTPRILWQAFYLHFSQQTQLDVFPKPDPILTNEVDGTIGFQRSHWSTNFAREIVTEFLRFRVNELANEVGQPPNEEEEWSEEEWSAGEMEEWKRQKQQSQSCISVTIKSHRDSTLHFKPDTNVQVDELVITILSPQFYVDILSQPTPSMALLVESQHVTFESQRSWYVSNPTLFNRLFSSSSLENGPTGLTVLQPTPRTLRGRFVQWLRFYKLRWSLSFIDSSTSLKNRTSWLQPPHYIPIDVSTFQLPLHVIEPSIKVMVVLLYVIVMDHLTYWSFEYVSQTRFVRGFEPWLSWKRVVLSNQSSDSSKQVEEFGSVRRV